MRKSFAIAAVAGMLCASGMAGDAAATLTISLVWETCSGGGSCSGIGSNTLVVDGAGGQTARLGIYLTHDEPQVVGGYGLSLAFDTDLANEFDVVTSTTATNEWTGTDVHPGPPVVLLSPISSGVASFVESSGASAGRINTYESFVSEPTAGLPATGAPYSVGTYGPATAPASYRIGFATFVVNGGITDGSDIFSGLFRTGADLIYGNPPTSFGSASVNLVPEPGTLSLLSLGLASLILTSRRRRP